MNIYFFTYRGCCMQYVSHHYIQLILQIPNLQTGQLTVLVGGPHFQTQTKAINHRVRHRLRIIENEGAVWWHLVYQSVQHWPLAADATSNTTSCLSTTDKWHYRRSVERRGYRYRHKHRGIAGDRITTVNTTAADQACFAGKVLKSWEKTGCPSPHFYV